MTRGLDAEKNLKCRLQRIGNNEDRKQVRYLRNSSWIPGQKGFHRWGVYSLPDQQILQGVVKSDSFENYTDFGKVCDTRSIHAKA
jgi:hypothetical protein